MSVESPSFRSGGQYPEGRIASYLSVVTADPPAQEVSKETWPRLAGKYRLMLNGWTFHVVLRDGNLFGGRDPNKLALVECVRAQPNAKVACRYG